MSRDGNKRFDRCRVRSIEFVNYAYDKPVSDVFTGDGRIGQPANAQQVPRTRGGKGRYAGTEAILHCPKTEDERMKVESPYNNHDGAIEARRSLRIVAGEIACAGCRFATMTPQEVAVDRALLADAETQRLAAYAARNEVLRQITARENE